MNYIEKILWRLFLLSFAISSLSFSQEKYENPSGAKNGLNHVHKVIIPQLVKDHDGDRAVITRLVNNSITVICHSLFYPRTVKDKDNVFKVEIPQNYGAVILEGTMGRLNKAKNLVWSITFSTGISGTLKLYVDSKSKDLLLAYIIPEG